MSELFLSDLASARDNIAAQLAAITANPKPSYDIDGQRVSWDEHFAALSRELERLDAMLRALEPYELDSTGYTG